MRNFILLIALFFVTQWLLKKLRRANERAQAAARSGGGRASSSSSSSSSSRPEASAPPQLADPLVRCAQCGVHTPRSESVVLGGQRFCCTEHAHRYAARPTGRDAR
jgi:uncharacterized protein